ncbi:MAG: hypothetical protein A3F72_19930 [Bacteroidetes bacterium RIFCSPLOWO2_12_FULL_35_15]|nr:MAG: hypothetical protein A3F72_19930 [Bacteroidetes bacterium RIFCSPLOWO2_12_FULL_35_15]
MNSEKYEHLEDNLNKAGTSLKDIERVYPKICESFIPLSITGVSPRTYFYWKKSNLLAPSATKKEGEWVRLNLIEYVWIKIIQTMRDFGVPFETIKEAKVLLFSNTLKILIDEKEGYLNFLEKESDMSIEKINSIKKLVDLLTEDILNVPEEYEIYTTLLGSIVSDLLIRNDRGAIIITKNASRFEIGYFSFKSMMEFQKIVFPLLELPCIQIPIRKLIEDFFDDPKSEKFVDSFELLNLKEKKVIEAIRKKDFKEIIIKQDSKEESIIIEVEKDGAIMDQKAKEVKRILGLNEYSEVTIKYRNDKHLYFKNKTRL